VALQLSVDACGRTFIVDDGEVNAGVVSLFGGLSSSAQSAVSPPFPDSDSDAERRSLSLLFRRLWNSSLDWEYLFAGLLGCVRSLPDSVSLLSVDRIDSLLSEDALFELILGISPDYFRLLRRVRCDPVIGSRPPAFERAT
jgi:hypothetical protein